MTSSPQPNAISVNPQEDATQQADEKYADTPDGSKKSISEPEPLRINARFPLCKYCRMKEIDYTSLKRKFIAALFAYDTAKRLVKLADMQLVGKFGSQLNPVYRSNNGREWVKLCGEFDWVNWHQYFYDAVSEAEYSMTKTMSCFGCQFENRMKKARLAIALGEAVKGKKTEEGEFEKGVKKLLDDAVEFAARMMGAGEII